MSTRYQTAIAGALVDFETPGEAKNASEGLVIACYFDEKFRGDYVRESYTSNTWTWREPDTA